MIIKLVSAFADLGQNLVCAVPDIDLVRKSLGNIAKKMFISDIQEYVLRFADAKGENVDYTKPRIDPAKKWNQQGVGAGTIVYVLKKAAELPEEEQEKIMAEAREQQALDDAQRSLNEELEQERNNNNGDDDSEKKIEESNKRGDNSNSNNNNNGGGAVASASSESEKEYSRPKQPTPPRTATPTRISNQQQQPEVVAKTAPPPPPTQPQQQQQTPASNYNNNNNNNNQQRTNSSVVLFQQQQQSSALNLTPPPPPSGNITVIDSPHASSSAPDMKTSETLIYQLREQNRSLRDHVFALEQRNRELEARVISNAYSSESSPAVVAQMQLKLRDAEIEIQRLRNNELFLRDQLAEARKNHGGAENSTQSVLDKLDPQTRAMLVEDKAMLDNLVERRRQNLASTLSLYQLAHDDVELSKIRIQQERERREAILSTTAFSQNSNNNNSRQQLLQITTGSNSSTVSSRRK